jgi:hypothetical protein
MRYLSCYLALFILLSVLELSGTRVAASSKFYSFIGSGIGYRDWIAADSEHPFSVISPYFEYGTGNPSGHIIGFNAMVFFRPTDRSKGLAVQFGGKVKYFLVPRMVFLGMGVGCYIEGKNAYRLDDEVEPASTRLSIPEPRLFPNINGDLGIAIPLSDGNSLVLDFTPNLSFRKPYPYSFNLNLGFLTFY